METRRPRGTSCSPDGARSTAGVLCVVVAHVRRATGPVGGKRRVVDLDHATEPAAGDCDLVVVAAPVRDARVPGLGPVGVADLVHVVRRAVAASQGVWR